MVELGFTEESMLELLDDHDFYEERELKETHDTLPTSASSITRYLTRKVAYDDYCGRESTPLIEVLSVCISTDFNDDKPSEIYGSIRVLEEDLPRFDLYDRNSPDNSDTIWKHGTLSLTSPDLGPNGGAIIPSMIIPSLCPTLDLCLKDMIRDVEVVNGRLNLDPVGEDSYDKLLKGVVKGSHGVAYVYYVVFQFAVYATIKVVVTTNDNLVKEGSADIYGSIVTEYENGKMFCSDNDEVKWLEIRLFDKRADQPLHVLLGKPIRLLRNVVTVPSYSSLLIKVNLWNSGGNNIAEDCLQFQYYLSLRGGSQRIQTQYACVEVSVIWHHAYYYLYKDRYVKFSKVIKSYDEMMQEKLKVLYDEHDSASFIPRNIHPHHFGEHGTEVFTVFVAGFTEKISNLCGAIKVDDGSRKIAIYNRDDSCSEMLSEDGLLSIDVNYCAIRHSEIGMILNLWDPVRKLEVSKGYLGWNLCSLNSYMSFYNVRLCSVVRGDNGFAAVHYSIFRDSFQALVEVKLLSEAYPSNYVNLFGTLFGRYGGYDYSTSYQKKYYSSRLFNQPKERPVQAKVGYQISLLKSIVLVPSYSFLVIEANLGAPDIDGMEDSISGVAEFEIDTSDDANTRKISGKHYQIEISVTFKDY